MTLPSRLGIGAHELVAFVGAGGKSTLMLGTGRDLVTTGHRVALTTTTKMGSDQIPRWARPVERVEAVAPTLAKGEAPFLIAAVDRHKIVGVGPDTVDEVFAEGLVDHLLVEADGARGRYVKAPGTHEPVIPSRTTRVVVVASLRAVGRPLAEVAHRPERVAAVLGRDLDHILTPDDIVALVTSTEGGLARIPAGAAVTVALTGSTSSQGAGSVDRVRRLLESDAGIDRVAVIPPAETG